MEMRRYVSSCRKHRSGILRCPHTLRHSLHSSSGSSLHNAGYRNLAPAAAATGSPFSPWHHNQTRRKHGYFLHLSCKGRPFRPFSVVLESSLHVIFPVSMLFKIATRVFKSDSTVRVSGLSAAAVKSVAKMHSIAQTQSTRSHLIPCP